MANLQQIKGDAAVGVKPQDGVLLLRVIHPADLGAALRVQRPISDRIPGVAAGGGHTFNLLLGRHRHRIAAIWHEHPGHPAIRVLHLGRPLDALQPVRLNVAMVAELDGRQIARAQVDTAAFDTTAHHVGEIETITSKFGYLGTRGCQFLSEMRFLTSDALCFRAVHFALPAFHPSKHGPQPVIFLLLNGIELVVMTACAVDRDAHRGGDDLRDHVIEISRTSGASEHVALSFHLPHKVPRSGGEKSSGNDGLRIIRHDHIPRDLLADELIIGLVSIERFNDIVTIAPHIGAQLITLKAVCVGVMGDVEPVPCPALAVMGGVQQFIHQLLIRLGIRIFHKLLHPFRGWWQADQIKA